jgi:hypothetical protein
MPTAVSAVAALVACFASTTVHAQPTDFARDCAQWIDKKGYSADYIKLKTGMRQKGMPLDWRGNVEPKDVQPGDVVISYIREKGRNMRVAYVEEVRRNADGGAASLIVSEWNMGRYIDERCFVTDHFGRLSESRPMPIDTITKVWRPSLPLSATNTE